MSADGSATGRAADARASDVGGLRAAVAGEAADAGAFDATVAAAVFAACFLYLLALGPFDRPLLLDPATWDYMSVRIAAGDVPYRDVFLHKTPGAALLGAAGAALASMAGAEPVHGAHAAFLVLGAAGGALLYLLCRRTMPPLPSLAAAIFLFAFDQWPLASVEGVRAQVATVTLGLATLVFAEHGRFLASGIFGGAAVLCWQPAAAFLAGALCVVRPRQSDVLSSVARLTLGAMLPVAALLAWFAATGALQAFFAQAVGFNVHYIALHAKAPMRTIAKIAGEMLHLDKLELWLAPAAILGLARGRLRLPVSLVVSGALYVAMTFVSFQAWPDTILFGAPLAAVLAAGLTAALALVVEAMLASALVVAIAAGAAAMPSAARLAPPITFSEQAIAMRGLAAGLKPRDSVVAVSLPEFLIHTGRRSRWPWPYMWFGVDRFAADHTAGGFAAILADLEREPPALIVVARHWAGPLRRQFTRWVESRYEREIVRIYPHVRRPILVYRLRTRP